MLHAGEQQYYQRSNGVLSVLVSQPALEGPLVAEYVNPGLVVKLFRLQLSSQKVADVVIADSFVTLFLFI